MRDLKEGISIKCAWRLSDVTQLRTELGYVVYELPYSQSNLQRTIHMSYKYRLYDHGLWPWLRSAPPYITLALGSLRFILL